MIPGQRPVQTQRHTQVTDNLPLFPDSGASGEMPAEIGPIPAVFKAGDNLKPVRKGDTYGQSSQGLVRLLGIYRESLAPQKQEKQL